MFGPSFFGVTYFGPVYFPPAGAGVGLPGGGTGGRTRRHVPGITGTRAIAMREDEEVLAMLEAYFNTKRH